jgi:hypothetical protein
VLAWILQVPGNTGSSRCVRCCGVARELVFVIELGNSTGIQLIYGVYGLPWVLYFCFRGAITVFCGALLFKQNAVLMEYLRMPKKAVAGGNPLFPLLDLGIVIVVDLRAKRGTIELVI